MKIDVIYSMPFEEGKHLAAENELLAMGDLEKIRAVLAEEADAEDALAQLDQLAERRSQILSSLPLVGQWRLTVRACSYMDRAHYRQLVSEGMGWFTEKTGREIDEDLTGNAELMALRDLVYFRAEMLCSVERKSEAGGGVGYMAQHRAVPWLVAEGEQSSAVEWKAEALPQEWLSLESMGDAMPTALLDEWLRASRELNAGVLSSIPVFFRKSRVKRSVSG